MTYNDLLAIGSASSRRVTLFGSRKGSEERNLFVCLVWFRFSQRKILRHEKKTFFSLFQAFPPPPHSSCFPPSYHQTINKKMVDKAGVEGFSFSSFFPLCNYSLLPALGSLIYTTCPFSSLPPSPPLSLSLSLPPSPLFLPPSLPLLPQR